MYRRWAKNFGCDTELLCEVGHLVERKDLERSLSCIHAVARRVAELRMPYPNCVRLEVGYCCTDYSECSVFKFTVLCAVLRWAYLVFIIPELNFVLHLVIVIQHQ